MVTQSEPALCTGVRMNTLLESSGATRDHSTSRGGTCAGPVRRFPACAASPIGQRGSSALRAVRAAAPVGGCSRACPAPDRRPRAPKSPIPRKSAIAAAAGADLNRLPAMGLAAICRVPGPGGYPSAGACSRCRLRCPLVIWGALESSNERDGPRKSPSRYIPQGADVRGVSRALGSPGSRPLAVSAHRGRRAHGCSTQRKRVDLTYSTAMSQHVSRLHGPMQVGDQKCQHNNCMSMRETLMGS